MRARALVLAGFGINCEAETAQALHAAGADEVRVLHLSDLLENAAPLDDAALLVLPGGFSFGDHLGAGRALANRLRCRLAEPLRLFVDDGRLVLGICNGFQVLACLGLLPDPKLGTQQVSLAHNARGHFHDGWVHLVVDTQSPCVFTRGLTRFEAPVRHGEGRLVVDAASAVQIGAAHLAPLRYADALGQSTMRFPENPNGSHDAIAGLCDPRGRIFGLMPHPEAFLYPENHPQWRHRTGAADGLAIFRNAIDACREV